MSHPSLHGYDIFLDDFFYMCMNFFGPKLIKKPDFDEYVQDCLSLATEVDDLEIIGL